jgi:hypothetical protein
VALGVREGQQKSLRRIGILLDAVLDIAATGGDLMKQAS